MGSRRARCSVIVLDASAAVELLLNSTAGHRVADRLNDPAEVVHIPHLLAVEVAQVLRKMVLAGILESDRAADALADLAELNAERHEHEPLLDRIWALRHNATAYDAVYLALAEALEAPLVTLDAKLAGVTGHQAPVELVTG